jgi:hypothetical protein
MILIATPKAVTHMADPTHITAPAPKRLEAAVSETTQAEPIPRPQRKKKAKIKNPATLIVRLLQECRLNHSKDIALASLWVVSSHSYSVGGIFLSEILA